MVSLFGPQPDPFEFTWAWAVSDDGRMIVGGRGDLCRYRTTAVVWNPEEGVQDLPSISPQSYNDAFDISADGTVIVGTAGQQGVRWESGTIAALGPWRAMAVSADGSTVAGYNPGPPWMWLWQGETLSSLGAGVGLPTDLSADGSTLVGMSPELGAFRWTAQEGMVGLGPVPPSSPYWYDDPASVKLICAGSNGGASPVSMAYEDAGAKRAAGKTDRSPAQGNGPGDLVLKFRTEDVVEQLKLDTLTRGETVLLSVTGKLLDGRLFAGSDLVRIVQ